MFQDVLTVGPLALILRWEPQPQDTVLLAGIDLRWSHGPEVAAAAAQDFTTFPFREDFRARLERHLRGEDPDWTRLPASLALDMRPLPDFSRTVLETLWHGVGFGQTVTYGQLARMAGRPGTARAVGRVMASNRWPLVIPCHRVLGSTGALTGFSGGGVEMKQLLLEKEALRGS
ncbi:methylated-DNA--[protein]-cysteine S-methyltransferase [Megalodesulfovibrio gigas]|uniref:Methylated-DNA--protein-cysteine methyltransferase n=1 Tax=Megalodesulfovibrio gigas (strain ATCC 19364 / DSM 1382 / NCIMB 9332 / VKM B-1759) TaxID=1121448 RepID=T2G7M6_MEGG1|nr:MGMT family protein [Megalodesulfovibrio gigas]AGW12570.1 putative methylated-DNA/protein-cysteine methyltransferase [Megalodesulfovibrio gigas DSM 1382 = ATCC 19364]